MSDHKNCSHTTDCPVCYPLHPPAIEVVNWRILSGLVERVDVLERRLTMHEHSTGTIHISNPPYTKQKASSDLSGSPENPYITDAHKRALEQFEELGKERNARVCAVDTTIGRLVRERDEARRDLATERSRVQNLVTTLLAVTTGMGPCWCNPWNSGTEGHVPACREANRLTMR